MQFYLDSIKIKDSNMVVLGWAAGDAPDSYVDIKVLDSNKNEVPLSRTDTTRQDVTQYVFHGEGTQKLGFCVLFGFAQGEKYTMVFSCDGKTGRQRLDPKKGKSTAKKRGPAARFLGLFTPGRIKRGFEYLGQYGPEAFGKAVKRRVSTDKLEYNSWRREVAKTPDELELERGAAFETAPVFSIVVPVYRTPDRLLGEMIGSVIAQTYPNWKMILADGSGDACESARIKAQIDKYLDDRITYICLGENLGIAGNTNAALKEARGDYIVFIDHDDTIEPDALYECARCIEREAAAGRCADVIYTDEDKMKTAGGSLYYFDPHFKPDYSPDLLRSTNYISHMFVVRRGIASAAGGLCADYDGAQDYDFILKCTELAENICHIPMALYHWRVSADSTAAGQTKKLYAFEAGARAIKAHCARMGYGNVTVTDNEVLGTYRVRYPIDGTPLVSVVIPNKNHTDDLITCVTSLMEKATYKNLQVIVVENNSTEEITFKRYSELEEKYSNLRVITWKSDGGFNFSAINNYAIPYCEGEYILFLNNDTELIAPDCIEEMLMYCQREDVGIVGARLFYDDDTIQHAGVVIGYGGIAGHTFIGYHRGEKTYFLRASLAQDYSAVTAACMMTKKSLFNEVGGFDEDLAVAFNDIDYCMKVRTAGKLVVYNPFAELYHYESKSRGIEDTPERVLRFEHEVETFRAHWPDILKNGDPYYNPNLTLLDSDFSLRDLQLEPLDRGEKQAQL